MSDVDRQGILTTPGSPLSIKRKPVPTPRSTLRKPSTSSHKLVFINSSDDSGFHRQRNLSLDTDGDSQVSQPTGCWCWLCAIKRFIYNCKLVKLLIIILCKSLTAASFYVCQLYSLICE